MSLKRYATRRDANEDAITEALRACHATIVYLSGLSGVPDLLVALRGQLTLLEVKGPKGKLTQAQQSMRANLPFTIVRTPDEALRAIGVCAGEDYVNMEVPCPICGRAYRVISRRKESA